ncbi:MAG: hypothetical protein L0241_23110 [Planctomycetia bacterium]|nr:hypothetical protein [Planctomycetia bacterium]
MIQRAAILLGVPVLVAALAVVPLGLWRGEYQWLCAAVAVGLIVPPGLVTLIVADRFGKSSAYGRVAAVFVGTFVRLVVGFGGAVLVFQLNKQTFQSDAISFWLWVLGVYLVTLVVETALLSGKPVR